MSLIPIPYTKCNIIKPLIIVKFSENNINDELTVLSLKSLFTENNINDELAVLSFKSVFFLEKYQ
jgi:hypothetical protein